jgi:hypothetical protein
MFNYGNRYSTLMSQDERTEILTLGDRQVAAVIAVGGSAEKLANLLRSQGCFREDLALMCGQGPFAAKAVESLKAAVQKFGQTDSPVATEARTDLGRALYRAAIFSDSGPEQLAEARDVLRGLTANLAQSKGEDKPLLAQACLFLGYTEAALGHYDAAYTAFREPPELKLTNDRGVYYTAVSLANAARLSIERASAAGEQRDEQLQRAEDSVKMLEAYYENPGVGRVLTTSLRLLPEYLRGRIAYARKQYRDADTRFRAAIHLGEEVNKTEKLPAACESFYFDLLVRQIELHTDRDAERDLPGRYQGPEMARKVDEARDYMTRYFWLVEPDRRKLAEQILTKAK